ncbi:Uncharacterised protein [Nocardia africana]|uniref:Uncharacterized protein n=1 Tax=Nocardia africana TaxID=134964 RepID=A0A378X258_9NOCA|nr:Uncharacterised protein [Nocardia africana]
MPELTVGTESLFAACVLPGCTTPVALVGDACEGCRTAFGDMLVITPGARRMTAEEIAERDRGVHNVYAWQAMQRGRNV